MPSRLRKTLTTLIILGLLGPLGIAAPSPAQNGFGEALHTEASLIAEMQSIAPGEPFWIGIHLKMAEHWHTYWKNPGESGLATQVKWQLPEGWQVGELQWPVPQRIQEGTITTFGYEKSVLLMARVTPPDVPPGSHQTLAAKVIWLECKEICIPGAADVSLRLPVTRVSQPNADTQAIFKRFLNRVPTPSPAVTPAATAVGKQVQVVLAFPEAQNFTLLEFFPLEPIGLEMLSSVAEAAEITATFELAPYSRIGENFEGVFVLQNRKTGAQQYLFVQTPLSSGRGAAASPAAAAGTATAPLAPGLLLMLCFAFIGGLLLNIMPCVFPVLAIKILGFVEQARENPGKVKLHGLAFMGGVVLSFWALTALLLVLRVSGEQLGWGFQLQSPPFLLGLILLLTAISVNLLGAFEVGVGLTGIGTHTANLKGYTGSFAAGLLATVLATPCSAPFMGAAVGFTLTRSAFETFLIFTALGLGMAAPYGLLSFFPGWLRRLPRPGSWMETFKQVMSFPLLLTAVWLIWVLGHHISIDGVALLLFGLIVLALAGWAYGRWQSGGRGIAKLLPALLCAVLGLALSLQSLSFTQAHTPAASLEANWTDYSESALQTALQNGQPVFIDFTAAWCLTCQVNKRFLHTEAVEARFEALGVLRMRADWTLQDADISRALAEFGRRSVPLYVLYPGKDKEPIVLPEVLSERILLKHLEAVAGN